MQDILQAIAQKVGDTKGDDKQLNHAPVHLWSPEYCGELDIKINADGSWYYQNSLIDRQKLVKLFSSVLWRDIKGDGATYLVTPVEKIKITVVDAAFIATDMVVEQTGANQQISFSTNHAGQIALDAAHPIRFSHKNNQFMAYILVRYGLEAKLSRTLCFELVDYMVERNGQMFLTSHHVEFPV